jgi:hypothetical protein
VSRDRVCAVVDQDEESIVGLDYIGTERKNQIATTQNH